MPEKEKEGRIHFILQIDQGYAVHNGVNSYKRPLCSSGLLHQEADSNECWCLVHVLLFTEYIPPYGREAPHLELVSPHHFLIVIQQRLFRLLPSFKKSLLVNLSQFML